MSLAIPEVPPAVCESQDETGNHDSLGTRSPSTPIPFNLRNWSPAFSQGPPCHLLGTPVGFGFQGTPKRNQPFWLAYQACSDQTCPSRGHEAKTRQPGSSSSFRLVKQNPKKKPCAQNFPQARQKKTPPIELAPPRTPTPLFRSPPPVPPFPPLSPFPPRPAAFFFFFFRASGLVYKLVCHWEVKESPAKKTPSMATPMKSFQFSLLGASGRAGFFFFFFGEAVQLGLVWGSSPMFRVFGWSPSLLRAVQSGAALLFCLFLFFFRWCFWLLELKPRRIDGFSCCCFCVFWSRNQGEVMKSHCVTAFLPKLSCPSHSASSLHVYWWFGAR